MYSEKKFKFPTHGSQGVPSSDSLLLHHPILLLNHFAPAPGPCTPCTLINCSPPGSSVQEIPQARILEGVAIPFSRGFSWPRDRTQVSRIAGRFLIIWGTREAHAKNISSYSYRTTFTLSAPFIWNIFPSDHHTLDSFSPAVFPKMARPQRGLPWPTNLK